MPPLYKPLDAPIPSSGLLGQDFNTPALDFSDLQKIKAQKLAEDLANQQKQIELQATQQKFDQTQQDEADKQQLADIIAAKYGASIQPQTVTTIDPNSANYTPADGSVAVPTTTTTDVPNAPIDPKEGLRLAQQFYLEHGDTKQALDVEKALNPAGAASAASRPLTPAERTAFETGPNGLKNLPPDATVRDVQLLTSLQNSSNQAGRVDVMRGNLDLKKDFTLTPGMFDNKVNPSTGRPMPLTTDQKTRLADASTSLDTVGRNGDKMISLIQGDGRYNIIGDPGTEQLQLMTDMVTATRKLQHTGMQFNELIKSNDLNAIGDDATLARRILGGFTGQDPAAAIERYLREVASQTNKIADENNAVASPQKAYNFSPDTFDLYNKYGLYNRGQPQNNPAGTQASGAVQADGSIKIPKANNPNSGLTPEESIYKEQKKQEYLNKLRTQSQQGQ